MNIEGLIKIRVPRPSMPSKLGAWSMTIPRILERGLIRSTAKDRSNLKSVTYVNFEARISWESLVGTIQT